MRAPSSTCRACSAVFLRDMARPLREASLSFRRVRAGRAKGVRGRSTQLWSSGAFARPRFLDPFDSGPVPRKRHPDEPPSGRARSLGADHIGVLDLNKTILVAVVALGLLTVPVYTTAATTHLVLKHGNVSPLLDNALDLGNAAPTQEMRIVWSLDLRNRAALDQFLADVQDPASPVFHQFLASADFNALYAPTAAQEAQVVDFLSASGFTVTQTFSNRLLVEAKAPVSVVESTFGVDVHAFLSDGEVYLAAVNDPSVPEGLASFTVGILGLGDVGVVHPMSHAKLVLTPTDNLGTNCCYFS